MRRETRKRVSSSSHVTRKPAYEPVPRLTLDPIPSWEFDDYGLADYNLTDKLSISSPVSSSWLRQAQGADPDELAWRQHLLEQSLQQVFHKPLSLPFQAKNTSTAPQATIPSVSELDRSLLDAAAMATGPTADEEIPAADPIRDKAQYDAVVARMRPPNLHDKQKRGRSSTIALPVPNTPSCPHVHRPWTQCEHM